MLELPFVVNSTMNIASLREWACTNGCNFMTLMMIVRMVCLQCHVCMRHASLAAIFHAGLLWLVALLRKTVNASKSCAEQKG